MCDHSFLFSDYSTTICRLCGLELPCPLAPAEGYTDNIPLELGYSRYNRMSTLLSQLFQPTRYGTPNSRVVFEVLKCSFSDGVELLLWLSRLPLKNKKYQNSHYYFAVHNKGYAVPTPPPRATVCKILNVFSKLEIRFEKTEHGFKSFFSYNWLLRRFLTDFKLEFYLQYVKKIKCKKRVQLYEKMYKRFTSEDNVVTEQDVFQKSQIRRGVPQDDGCSYPLPVRFLLGPSRDSHQHNWVCST